MSANLDSCFQYIFGLSRTTCICNGIIPTWATPSDSNLWLDELENMNLNMIGAQNDCGDDSMWYRMATARENALKEFKEDLLNGIRSLAKLKRRPFTGLIGEYDKMSSNITATKNYHGLRLRMADIVGGKMVIKRIGTAFNNTGQITVKVYNNQDDDILYTIVLDIQAGKVKWNTLSTPIEIDLRAPFPKNLLEYHFIYQPYPGLEYRNSRTSCGCGGGFHPTFNTNTPDFQSSTPKGDYGWSDYLIASGFYGDTLSQRDDWSTFRETQGLILDVSIGCDAEKTLCDGELDYVTNPYAKTSAYAVRYKAGAWLIDNLLSGPSISRYTTSSADQLTKYRNEYIAKYNERIGFLAQEMSRSEYLNTYSDCFTCKEADAMMRIGLLV